MINLMNVHIYVLPGSTCRGTKENICEAFCPIGNLDSTLYARGLRGTGRGRVKIRVQGSCRLGAT